VADKLGRELEAVNLLEQILDMLHCKNFPIRPGIEYSSVKLFLLDPEARK
jgi:hypothetical protein